MQDLEIVHFMNKMLYLTLHKFINLQNHILLVQLNNFTVCTTGSTCTFRYLGREVLVTLSSIPN